MSAAGTILVYRCGALGDTIVSIPAIHAVRAHFPGARLVLMTANDGNGILWTDEVLRPLGWFDDTIRYSSSDLRSVRRLWRLVRRVQSLGPDAVVHLASDWNSAARILRDRLFFRLAGVRRFHVSTSSKVTFWGRFRRSRRLYPSEVDRLLDGLRQSGIASGAPRFELPRDPTDVERVDRILREHGLGRERPLVAMCPGSKQEIKRWPLERYAEVGRRLIAAGGADVVVIGGEDEARAAATVTRDWPAARWASFAGRLTVLESAELLRRCLFYLGNDTGAMHLAAAVGTRCVAIFSAREPARSWHPYGENHIVLRKHVPCAGCYFTRCTGGLRCLMEIGIEEVWDTCQRVMLFQ